MNTRQLGRTGLHVSEICLGTMTFGVQCDERTSFAILDRAIDSILDGEISIGTRSSLKKQMEQPLPEVKAGEVINDAPGDMANMRGQGRRGMNRQARLLQPSGDPVVFKAVSLVLGTPEFQRQ